MQAPPKPIDWRRRPLSSSERALLEWWLAQRIAEASVQPLSPFHDGPAFDVGYQVHRDVALCAVDDPEDDRRLVDRLKARILDLRRAATVLDRPDAIKVIALDGPPADARFEPALRDKGIRLIWQGGPALPLLARSSGQ